jgi:hypothetical protein
MIVKVNNHEYNAINYFISGNHITINEEFHAYQIDISDKTPIHVDRILVHGEMDSITSLFG